MGGLNRILTLQLTTYRVPLEMPLSWVLMPHGGIYLQKSPISSVFSNEPVGIM